jgi:hypothetical protein
VCGCLKNGVALGETETSVYRERGPTVTACGNEVSDVRAEEVVQTQEEDIRLALSLSTVTAADKVCFVCHCVGNTGACLYCGICVLAVCCVVFRCDCTVEMVAVSCFESLVPTITLTLCGP